MDDEIPSSNGRLNIIHIGNQIEDLTLYTNVSGKPSGLADFTFLYE